MTCRASPTAPFQAMTSRPDETLEERGGRENRDCPQLGGSEHIALRAASDCLDRCICVAETEKGQIRLDPGPNAFESLT